MKTIMVALLLLGLMPVRANAENPTTLVDAYRQAQQYDATLRAAKSNNVAQQEGIDMAFAPFLPQARISAYKGKASTDREPTNGPGASQHFDYDSENYSFSVRQSIFSKANFAGYDQAKAVAAKSDAVLEKERLSLISRVVGSYLNLLFYADNMHYTEAQKESVESQLEQAKKRFKVGYGTITEISEAEANLQQVIAKQLEWSNGLEYAKRELETMTGVYLENYLSLDPGKLPLTEPNPARVDDWIAFAYSKNPDILAAAKDIEVARQEISKNSSGHYPTLDLVASRAHTESDAANTIGSRFDTDSIGLQLNVPIYSGGYVTASVRQAVAKQGEAEETLSAKQRAVAVDVRKYYNEVVNGIARIHALEASVSSYEMALVGTQKGFTAGVRSNVDVLNAQEKLYSAKRDLSKERYSLIFNRIQLKQTAGLLTESDIQESSNWLSMRP